MYVMHAFDVLALESSNIMHGNNVIDIVIIGNCS